MNRTDNHTLLFVDSETKVLKSLCRLFKKQGISLLTAGSGEEALDIMKNQEKPISLIISDQRMSGISGIDLLEKSKQFFPDAIRFLLTGDSDIQAVVDGINRGEIDRFFTKPWNDEDLVLQADLLLDKYETTQNNKKLLELTKKQAKQLYLFGKDLEQKVLEQSRRLDEQTKELQFLKKELELNLFNTVKAFTALGEKHYPELQGHGKRVATLSVKIAKKMGMQPDEISEIEIAAMIHDIGKIGLPNSLLTEDESGRDAEETERYRRHSVYGQEIVSFINRLDEVGFLIRHHHECFDGNGWPDGISGHNIPMGSRIIAVADMFDRIENIDMDKEKYHREYIKEKGIIQDQMVEEQLDRKAAAFHIKQSASVKYDPSVIKAFLEVLQEEGVKQIIEKEIRIEELSKGMILSRPIFTISKSLLLPYHTEITSEIISKLNKIYRNRQIENRIFILEE